MNWEGRGGSFGPRCGSPGCGPTCTCSARSPTEMDVHLACPTPPPPARELAALGTLARAAAAAAQSRAAEPQAVPRARAGRRRCWPPGTSCSTAAGCRTASRSSRARPARPWPGCRRRPRPRPARPTAIRSTVATDAGAVTVPVRVADLPDQVVWLPPNSAGLRRSGASSAAGARHHGHPRGAGMHEQWPERLPRARADPTLASFYGQIRGG